MHAFVERLTLSIITLAGAWLKGWWYNLSTFKCLVQSSTGIALCGTEWYWNSTLWSWSGGTGVVLCGARRRNRVVRGRTGLKLKR